LAQILVSRGELDEAQRLVSPVLPEPAAARLDAQIRVALWLSEPADGSLGDAKLAAAQGRWREALEGSLSALGSEADDAKEAMLTIFLALGDGDPLVAEYRRRLTNALF